MPDEAREVIFPQGIPVTMPDTKSENSQEAQPKRQQTPASPQDEPDAVATKAEAGLYSEAGVIEEQARQAQPFKDEENLLPTASTTPSSESLPTQ